MKLLPDNLILRCLTCSAYFAGAIGLVTAIVHILAYVNASYGETAYLLTYALIASLLVGIPFGIATGSK